MWERNQSRGGLPQTTASFHRLPDLVVDVLHRGKGGAQSRAVVIKAQHLDRGVPISSVPSLKLVTTFWRREKLFRALRVALC